jgi:hypothetical protein
MRNTRVPSSVLLVYIWKDINVIKKFIFISFWMTLMQIFDFFIIFIYFQMNIKKILERTIAFLVNYNIQV